MEVPHFFSADTAALCHPLFSEKIEQTSLGREGCEAQACNNITRTRISSLRIFLEQTALPAPSVDTHAEQHMNTSQRIIPSKPDTIYDT